MVNGEVLDFQRHNPVAVEAARLIVTSIYDDDDVAAAIDCYFIEADKGNYTNYGLLDEENRLTAAASVVHRSEKGPILHTEVVYIAVPTEYRRQGHGMALMRYIALNAQLHGDTVMSLYSLTSSLDFYRSLGFAEEMSRPKMMYINPDALASNQNLIV